MLEEILANNERFLQTTPPPCISHAPRKHTAVVTCMDCRLVGLFEDALGLERGDVIQLRTAGATISTPDRRTVDNDLIRSLAGGVYLLGVRRIIVVGHTDCGLTHVDPVVLTASMQALGVDPQHLIQSQGLGDMNGLLQWIGAFHNVYLNVQEVVDVIRKSPFLPKIPVYGLIIDIHTGKLTVVDDGSAGTALS
jgi:carbonic anhydrase